MQQLLGLGQLQEVQRAAAPTLEEWRLLWRATRAAVWTLSNLEQLQGAHKAAAKQLQGWELLWWAKGAAVLQKGLLRAVQR